MAHATGGSYAMGGSDYFRAPDGSTRAVWATFVIPGGTVVGSDRMSTADMRKPFAAISVSIWRAGDPGGGLAGPGGCATFGNPASWRAATSRTVPGPVQPERSYGGMQFTAASCPGDVYATYTVRWDAPVHATGPEWAAERDAQYPESQTWSWAQPLSGAGSLEADVTSVQSATVTVCGTRRTGGTDCFGGGSGGIYPTVRNLSMKAYSLS